MRIKSRFSIFGPLLLVLAFYVLSLHRFARTQFNGNITGFSYISRNYPAPSVWNDKTFVRNDDGYDGMFYYYIAHDPFIRTKIHAYFSDGWTAYRYQRIAYPLIVFLLSCGSAKAIPAMMVIVSVLAVLTAVFFIAKIAEFYGRSAWFAALFAFFPGIFLAVTRNLTEPTQIAFLCGGLYFYICRNSAPVSAIFLAFSSLSKETSLIAAAALFLHQWIWRRNFKSALFFLIPFALCFGWKEIVAFKLGQSTLSHGDYKNFHGYYSVYFIPFLPMFQIFADKLAHIDSPAYASNFTIDFSFMFFCIMAIFLSALGWKNRKEAGSLLLVVFGAFSAFIANPWIEYFGYGRTIAPLFLFLLLHFLSTGDKEALVPLFGALIPLFLFLKCAAVI